MISDLDKAHNPQIKTIARLMIRLNQVLTRTI